MTVGRTCRCDSGHGRSAISAHDPGRADVSVKKTVAGADTATEPAAGRRHSLVPGSPVSDVFVARQPIFDRNGGSSGTSSCTVNALTAVAAAMATAA